jgi:pyruvate formate lyase activating enzyme
LTGSPDISLQRRRGPAITGMIIKIERFAIHDGPGIRTAIFMKGCALRCKWCSNPESQRFEEETFRKLVMEPVGNRVSVEEIMEVVRKDYLYYSVTGGGITLTGGEPLHQPAFAQEILKACKAEDIQTAIETSGFAPWEDWEKMLPVLDLILFDLKHPDAGLHQSLTGVDNRPILENLERVAVQGIPVTIRIPLIPTYNDSPAVLAGFAAIMQSLKLKTVHLLPYHKMGADKYGWLGRAYELSEVKTYTEATLAGILEFFKKKGFAAQIGG